MAEKHIKIRGKLIAVSEEVYYAYYHMGRQRLTQAEKESRRKVASYDALDTEDGLGIDLLVDDSSPSVEDVVINRIMSEKLHQCIARLSLAEQKIISILFFDEMSEREAAQTLGIPLMTFHNRKAKVIRKLKKMMIR